MQIKMRSLLAAFVDIIVEQLVDKVNMGEKHPSAAIAGEANFIQQLAQILVLIHVTHLAFELFPLVSNNFPTTKASDWYYHFTNIQVYIINLSPFQNHPKINIYDYMHCLFQSISYATVNIQCIKIEVFFLYLQSIYNNLVICQRTAIYMYPYRDTDDQAFLDKLQSQIKQLFIRLGNVKSEENKHKIIAQMQKIKEHYKKIIPYEKYNDLRNQQEQIRLLEIKYVQQLAKQKQINQDLLQYNKQLKQLKEGFENKMRQTKQYEATAQKIKILLEQLKMGQEIAGKLTGKNLSSELSVLTKVEQEISKQIQKLERKIQLTKQAIQNQTEQNETQTKLCKQLLKRKQQTQHQLNEKRAKNIIELLVQTKSSKQQPLLQTQPQTQQNQNLQMRKIYKNYNMIKPKQQSKYMYWYGCWAVVLIIWFLVLLDKRNKISGYFGI